MLSHTVEGRAGPALKTLSPYDTQSFQSCLCSACIYFPPFLFFHYFLPLLLPLSSSWFSFC